MTVFQDSETSAGLGLEVLVEHIGALITRAPAAVASRMDFRYRVQEQEDAAVR
jgi:hypothetical protein